MHRGSAENAFGRFKHSPSRPDGVPCDFLKERRVQSRILLANSFRTLTNSRLAGSTCEGILEKQREVRRKT